jgi:hypothetical protein
MVRSYMQRRCSTHLENLFLFTIRLRILYMAPLKWLLAFLLVANTLESAFTTISTKGHTVTDAQNNAALEYVGLRNL